MFLLLQTGMIGVFISLDFFLFYIFWELVLVPMYFIIGIWGGAPQALRGHQVLPLYPGRLGADAAGHPHALLPALPTVRLLLVRDFGPDARFHAAGRAAMGVLGVLPGFAIKVPMFPFHTWLPETPTWKRPRRLRDTGRRPAENGNLRLHPLLRASFAPGLHG